jgi:hypothetical protein
LTTISRSEWITLLRILDPLLSVLKDDTLPSYFKGRTNESADMLEMRYKRKRKSRITATCILT